MLSTALAPVPRNGVESIGEVAEAFNLSALGAYPTVAVTSRCLETFRRAYGFANVKVYPKSVSGTPGFCVAFYPGETPAAVIAIAGIQTLSDLLNWVTNRFAVNMPGLDQCKVNQQFMLWADAIAITLAADADWVSFAANRRVTLRIGGFSAGAGIAEILATKYKLANPAWNPVVYKFASPRIGSARYQRWTEDNLQRANWFVTGDPIRTFPPALVRRFSITEGIPPNLSWQSVDMIPDPYCQALTPDGELSTGNPLVFGLDLVRVLNQLRTYSDFTTNPYDPPNRWWLHARTTYRWCFQQFLVKNSSIDALRMFGLEYPNENQWNARWNDFTTVASEMLTTLDPPPEEVEVSLETANHAREIDTSGDSEGGDWGDDSGGTTDGGDWGPEPPQQTREIRVRIRRQ